MVETKVKKSRSIKKMTESAIAAQLEVQPLESKVSLFNGLKTSIENDRKKLNDQLTLISGSMK
jgi:hypothetical protein